jgi:hypothetical protein
LFRLKRYPVLGIPIPNSIYFPARNDAERQIIARVVSQMKSSGQILPGAPDIVAMWSGGAGMLEIKRAASKDLFGRRQPAGRASPEQKEMEKRAAAIGVNYAFVHSWDEARDKLHEWGAL